MKSSVIPLSILALSLGMPAFAAGGVVRETTTTVTETPVVTPDREIVVQPPPVTREIIVQPPPSREVIVQRPVPLSCVYGPYAYSNGSVSCQDGKQFRCSDGTWMSSNLMC
jgi:hypothetical protein